MDLIKLKLSVSENDLTYNYLINNVSVGLSNALKKEKVKRNKKAFKELEKLCVEIHKVPLGVFQIDYEDQRKAIRIGREALEIINNLSR